ncbi:BAG family molecular chaperone regulator 4 [Glycine soja]
MSNATDSAGKIPPETRPAESDSGGDSGPRPTIKINVMHGSSQHEFHLPAQSTFGDVKKLLVNKTGLEPVEQRLFFRGIEKGDNLHLHLEGVKDKSKLLLLEGTASKERKLEETRKQNVMSKAFEAIAGVRAEVDKLSNRHVLLTRAKQDDVDDMVCFYLMRDNHRMTLTYFNIYMGFKTHESIRIEGLKAPPSTFDKQAFWKEIMGLEVYNPNALKYSKDIDIKDVALRLAHRQWRSFIGLGVSEICMVTSIEVAINGGNKASEKEFLVLTELLMSQLLKLDGIEAEGEAKLQRKAEVNRVQNLVDKLDSLKARNANPFSNSSNAVKVTTQWETFDSGMESLDAPSDNPSSTKVTQEWERFD